MIVICRHKFFSLLAVSTFAEIVFVAGWMYSFSGLGHRNPFRSVPVVVVVPFVVLMIGVALIFHVFNRGRVVVGSKTELVLNGLNVVDGKVVLSKRITEDLESVVLRTSLTETKLPIGGMVREVALIHFMRGDEELFNVGDTWATVPGYQERFQEWKRLLSDVD